MSKNELLLTIAKFILENGDFSDVIGDGNFIESVEEQYGVAYPEGKFSEGTPSERDGWIAWEKVEARVFEDLKALLTSLKKTVANSSGTEEPSATEPESATSPGSNYYFMQCQDMGCFAVVDKDFWDANHLLNELVSYKSLTEAGLDLSDFCECMESHLEHTKSYKKGLAQLKKLGFEEIDNPWESNEDDD